MDRATAPEKRALDTIHSTATADPWVRTRFLSRASHWSSGGKVTLCWRQATSLTGPISPTCDQYVQYLLAGLTHWSLTDMGRGYNIEDASFQYTTPRPSQLAVSPFHVRAPLGLQLNYEPSIKPNFKFKKPMATPWSFDYSAIYRGLHLRVAISNGVSLLIGIIWIDMKVTLCN
jgi:hypothetical protein